ncbi:MAG: restriction modification system specificity protein [Frankiales bacterium]|nr:restriction modification system specificity protein [Frankiales bacterium]
MPGASPANGPARHWLPLLLCASQTGQADGAYPLDRIRMQKAVFLLTLRGSARWNGLYPYRAYDWGPYCRELVDDLRGLAATGLMRTSATAGSRYGRYMLTEQGQQAADEVWESLPPDEQEFLTTVRAYVTSKDFNALLREVYAAYPEYATESRWNRQ